MSGTPDPLKDWLVAAWRDTVGDSGDARARRIGDDGRPAALARFVPFSPLTAASAAVAFSSPHLIAYAAGHEAVLDALNGLHDYRWPLAVATAPLLGLDLVRHRARRWTQMLESMVSQSTGHMPTKVTVALSPSWRTMRRASITMPRGAVIRPKQFEELSRAVESAFGGNDSWAMTVRHEASRDRLVITRTPIAPDTRSERHKALQDALDAASIFKNPRVSVDTTDSDGIETGYRITFDKSMNTGSPGFQLKVDEALASLAGVNRPGSGGDFVQATSRTEATVGRCSRYSVSYSTGER